jgi:hypothetical protein
MSVWLVEDGLNINDRLYFEVIEPDEGINVKHDKLKMNNMY